MNNCLFCNIAKEDRQFIYKDDQIFAIKDINPQTPVHLLIIPQRHIASINDITLNDKDLLGHMINTAKQLAKENNIAEKGYRLVFNCNQDGGQTVYHIHLHLLGGRKLQWPPA